MSSGETSVPHLAAGRPARCSDFLLQRRYRLVRPHLISGNQTLLDFGCGNGAQTLLFTPDFARIIGLDINAGFLREFRAAADRREPGGFCRPVLYAGGHFPLRDAAFDAAICFEVLEHVPDESLVLTELRRVLRPGGLLAISVPNRWWVFETHGANLPLLRWNRVPFFSWLPKRLHDRFARARIYRRREITSLLKTHGFTVEQGDYVTAPMDVVSFGPLRGLLRATLFRPDRTVLPMLATSVLILARRGRD